MLHHIIEQNIASGFLEDQRRVLLEGIRDLDHRLQRFILDIDELQGILRNVRIFSDHDCHRLSNIANPIHSHNILCYRFCDRSGGDRLGLFSDLLSGENGQDSLQFPGPTGIDVYYLGVSIRTSQDRRVVAFHIQIIHKGGGSPDQSDVFFPWSRLPYPVSGDQNILRLHHCLDLMNLSSVSLHD